MQISRKILLRIIIFSTFILIILVFIYIGIKPCINTITGYIDNINEINTVLKHKIHDLPRLPTSGKIFYTYRKLFPRMEDYMILYGNVDMQGLNVQEITDSYNVLKFDSYSFAEKPPDILKWNLRADDYHNYWFDNKSFLCSNKDGTFQIIISETDGRFVAYVENPKRK